MPCINLVSLTFYCTPHNLSTTQKKNTTTQAETSHGFSSLFPCIFPNMFCNIWLSKNSYRSTSHNKCWLHWHTNATTLSDNTMHTLTLPLNAKRAFRITVLLEILLESMNFKLLQTYTKYWQKSNFFSLSFTMSQTAWFCKKVLWSREIAAQFHIVLTIPYISIKYPSKTTNRIWAYIHPSGKYLPSLLNLQCYGTHLWPINLLVL